jgi:ABC-type uncharacterized transport system permease subunit
MTNLVSIAIASTFWASIAAAIVAAIIVLFVREQPMRDTFEMAEPASSDASAA